MTEEAVQDMPCARACVKEVLRLHPSVAFVFRRALHDFQYEGFLIQKVRGQLLRMRVRAAHQLTALLSTGA